MEEDSREYPPWQYLYQISPNPALAFIRQAVERNRQDLEDVRNTPFRKSVEAEKVLAYDMTQFGFWHSVTNRKYQALFRQGLNFEVDFFHSELEIAVEIEKGEISNIWKNVCKFAESPVIRHGVLLVPIIRQGQNTSSEFYKNTIKRLKHMNKIFSFVDSFLVIGY
ncbi:MAG: hypothetical protein H6Q73_775 [Firmicutes bacterium]|nr:hypothetical protein [Bacillota bacterium]